jgi:HK97 family phage major capsid protein
MNYEFMDLAHLKIEQNKLRQTLKDVHARNGKELSPEDSKLWDSTKAEIEAVEYYLRSAQVKEVETQTAQIIIDQKRFNDLKNKVKRNESRSNNLFGRIIKAQAGKVDEEVRGLDSTGMAKMIPRDRVQQTIFDLQSQNDLAAAGVQFITLENNAQWPRITDRGTAVFQNGNLETINDSQVSINSVRCEFKDVAIRFIVANQVLFDAAEDVEVILQQAMIEAINQKVLESAFSGSGASGQPTGLDNLSNILTVNAAGEKLTNYRFIIEAVKKLLDANMPMQNLSMFGSPDSWQQLESLTNGFGDPLREPNTIAQMRKFFTSAIKTDYGNSQDETKLYLGDFSRMLVGFQPAMTVITDGSASKLATEVIVHFRYDLLYLSPDSFCRIDGIETGLPEYGI